MDGFLVSAATGALKPVLEKLAAVLGGEYKRFKGVRAEIQSLSDELAAMHAFLLKMSENEDPDVQEKAWMKDVREMSYDIEDSLDEFMLSVDDKSVNPRGFIDKCKNLLTKAKTRRRVAKAIEEFKIKVKEVGDRNTRYKIHETIVKTSSETIDPRALAIFEDASKLIGIDEPKNKLIKLLTNVDALLQSQLQVVSIVGVGGLGKTTLANQVYQEIKSQFKCHAFVSVTRNCNPRNVLRNILCQVSYEPLYNIEAWDIQLLISKIFEALEDRRYLIILDDIWKNDAWKSIKPALRENNRNSKIIITTRKYDLAEACCSSGGDIFYEMKPLGHEHSKKLFFKRIFGSEEKCPVHLIHVSNKILEKCGGLPLAVISISSLLSIKSQTVDIWDGVRKSIGRSLGKDPEAKRMMQILSLSYFDLPNQLKSCLLYLSVFSEDSIIDKKCLVRRWTAEGFIQEEQGHTLYELGERCFNELVNRSLLQVCATNMYGEVINFKVHDTILDFIVLKSEEENFVIVFGDGYQKPDPRSKVRRLSLQALSQKNVSMPMDLNMSHIRSITVSGFKSSLELHLLSDFKYLRVLDLQGCRHLKDHHIAHVGSLLQLKYMSLCETGVYVLPGQIGGLRYMETLDLQKSEVTELPTSVVQLSRLVHFIFDRGVKLPTGIGRMAALEELGCVDVFKQPTDFGQDLGQLRYLRNVSFYLCKNIAVGGSQYKQYLDNIVSSLCKLNHLNSLSIEIEPTCEADFCLDSRGCTPRGLQKLEIKWGFISKVPSWVGYLINLQLLTLCVKEFEVEDIMSLGHLPALVFICLVAHESFQGRMFTISGNDGFHCLRSFKFGCAIPVRFEYGAMPNLENLTLMFSSLKTSQLVRHGDFHFGIQHLYKLKSVICGFHLSCDVIWNWISEKRTHMADMSCEMVMATLAEMDTTALYVGMGTEFAIRKTALVHPKSPKLEIRQITQWKITQLFEAPGEEHVHQGSNLGAHYRSYLPPPVFFQEKINFTMQYLHCMIRDLKKQERIRNCKLKWTSKNNSLLRLSSNNLPSGVPISPAKWPTSGAFGLPLATTPPSSQESAHKQTLPASFIFRAQLPTASEQPPVGYQPSQPGIQVAPSPSRLPPSWDQNALSNAFNNLSVQELSVVSSSGLRRHEHRRPLRRRAQQMPSPAATVADSRKRKCDCRD